ncbi:general substrate transporter [Aaosphaeria arxii CBS 175.79]|uniref:General substrate transporter n=1 Tax=Aaosphaeria arxii CBS 175.79 TaxID=1450172 RepID=A0A6A5XMR0_9PLEO|nr:general substrate transporter [Aaosphaeria arxii CBS 175.79]KAF2014545.1 general substrate transporter [Aaosphaeria arxii CBS 175.79]
MAIIGHKEEHLSDPRLTNIANADTKKWYRKQNLRLLYLTLVPCALGVEMTSGYDSSMMNGLQAVPAWDEYFNHPTGSRLGLYNAMYSLGALLAVPFVPFVSDKIGRRWTIITASMVMICGAALQGASVNYNMFMASRWLLGFGIPFAIVNASSLIGELAYARERPILTSVFNASWFVGSIVAAGTTYGTFTIHSTWAWRIPSILQAFPSSLQIIFMYYCPESPRWLIAKDRHEEAYEILRKYHGEGDDGEEFVRLEYAQIKTTISVELENSKRFMWADAWRDPAMRRRFLIAGVTGFFTQWSGNNLISFYLKKILNQVGIHDARLIQKIILSKTCWDFIHGLPIALIAPRFPRRKGFLTCTIGVMFVYIAWTIASARREITGSDSAAVVVIVFMFIYSIFYNIGWNALTYTYMVEIFPFQQRSKGIAFEQLTVRLANFFNTYINPIGLDSIGWKYYIFYCVWMIVEISTVYFLFPETHNRTLEELSFMFEGKEVQGRIEMGVEEVLEKNSVEMIREMDAVRKVDSVSAKSAK